MIYGYARVSTNGQAKDGNSLEDQSSLILSRYSDAQIVPESYSGAKERPIFLDLIGKRLDSDSLKEDDSPADFQSRCPQACY